MVDPKNVTSDSSLDRFFLFPAETIAKYMIKAAAVAAAAIVASTRSGQMSILKQLALPKFEKSP